MEAQTTRFGTVQVDEKEIIHFQAGLPGFPECHRFIIVPSDASGFVYMQSLDRADLAFILVSPFEFVPSYEFELDDTTSAELEVSDPSQLQVWNIVSIPGELRHATSNLAAPVLINMTSGQALQYIIPNVTYQIRHRLFPGQDQESMSEE